MKILLTNDDGIYAPGLLNLYEEIKSFGDVKIVAPYREQSGCSHSISLLMPLRVEKTKIKEKLSGYCVYGTPADCVKYAINKLYKKAPDLVLSGINQGANTGINAVYSGTVAGAREGVILGIPSISVSLTSKKYKNFTFASGFTLEFIKKIFKEGFPEGIFFNINIPKGDKSEIKGVRITKQSTNRFFEKYEARKDPFGKEYFWLTGEKRTFDNDSWDDESVVRKGYVSVTPLHYDQTAYNRIDSLQELYNT